MKRWSGEGMVGYTGGQREAVVTAAARPCGECSLRDHICVVKLEIQFQG